MDVIRTDKRITFGNLMQGECFEFDGEIFEKVNTVYMKNGAEYKKKNAYSPEYGTFVFVGEDEMTVRKNAILTVKE